MHDELLDRLTQFFTEDRWRDDLSAARTFFFEDAGVMDEHSDHFEMRIMQFLEWYLLTRKLDAYGMTPSHLALEIDDFERSAEELPILESIAESWHSLFRFERARGSDLHLFDLFRARPVVIVGSNVNLGFSRDELFSARLIPVGTEFRFSRAFCFHPAEASGFIERQVVDVRESGEEARETLILRLLKMRYRYEQYRHMSLDYVYTNERKTRF